MTRQTDMQNLSFILTRVKAQVEEAVLMLKPMLNQLDFAAKQLAHLSQQSESHLKGDLYDETDSPRSK